MQFSLTSWLAVSSKCFFILAFGGWLVAAYSVTSIAATDEVESPGVNGAAGSSVRRDQDMALYPLPIEKSVALGYGWREDPVTGKALFHGGIDLLAPVGTPVLAADDGTVAFAGKRGNYGNIVVVNHQGGRQTRYAHLDSIAVRVGRRVQQGDTLGTVGTTGSPDIDQPHLHFELRYSSPKGWVVQDPQPWLGISPEGTVVK